MESNSNSSQTTAPREHGFSYHVDGPWPGVFGLDQVVINGTFTLFINNVTLSGTSDQGDWEHWTGRQEDPHPGGASGEFESRVTFLHVEDGTLILEIPDAIDVIGPSPEVGVDGIVSAQAATGHLAVGDRGVDLVDEPVQLRGFGTVALSAASDGTHVNGALAGDGDRLVVRPSGSFDVRAGPEGLSTAGAAQAPASDAWGWEALAVVGLLAVALVTWTGRTSLAELREKVALELRERRISSWRATGDRLCEAHRYGRAAVWYRRVVERYPESAEAWHSLAEALEYDDRPSEASQAYERVSDRLGGDAYELVRAAKCAVKAGEEERAVGLLVDAGELEPETVRRALAQGVLTDLRTDSRLVGLAGSGSGDESRSYM